MTTETTTLGTLLYTPAPSCLESLSHVYAPSVPSGDLQWLLAGPLTTDGCFPPGHDARRDRFYSPGACPTGYTSACESEVSQFVVSDASLTTLTETVVTCCPA
jgi:hypothetical protein